LGLISDLKRKSLPAIAKVVGLKNGQSLHHFISQSPSIAEDLKKKRFLIIFSILEGREILVIIDETGDAKKGKKTGGGASLAPQIISRDNILAT
jgi:SRSO17 transposase